MRLRVFTTSGTIDKIYCDTPREFGVGSPQAGALLSGGNVDFVYSIEALCAKDSRELDEADHLLLREKIAAAPEQCILVTHGTDTMTRTGGSLRSLKDKIIVITGSMVPARFRESDALFNFGSAVAAFSFLKPGVYIAMHGRVRPANTLRKNRAAGRFEVKEAHKLELV
ncbi:asparaginase domain-containing protein [Oleiharenicola lentus]|uniref:asparaginase domain-containing protein n=1 Tax=Oleiharenicola lentus TaxID=2508720 RepID=UPI003F6687E3